LIKSEISDFRDELTSKQQPEINRVVQEPDNGKGMSLSQLFSEEIES